MTEVGEFKLRADDGSEVFAGTGILVRGDDCGQDGVCATAPGCSRHWEERCRELQERVAELEAEAALLKDNLAIARKVVDDLKAQPVAVEAELRRLIMSSGLTYASDAFEKAADLVLEKLVGVPRQGAPKR